MNLIIQQLQIFHIVKYDQQYDLEYIYILIMQQLIFYQIKQQQFDCRIEPMLGNINLRQ